MIKANFLKSNAPRIIALTVLTAAASAGIVYAAFADKGTVLGSKFSVGSSDLKLVIDTRLPIEESNLADELNGPSFTNITPNWQQNYQVKIFNNGTTPVQLTSNANYLTVDDPDDLRSILFVEPFEWSDTNSDGEVDEGELGTSYGRKTIVKWKTEGYDFGTIQTAENKSINLRFSSDSISETKQGKSGIFDFIFNSVSL